MTFFSNVDWGAVGAVSSAIASIIAFFTVRISLRNAKQADESQQYSVQPWFHVTTISKMGGNAPIKLEIINDASPHIRVNEIVLCIDGVNDCTKLKFRYLKKDSKYVATGKHFDIEIPSDEELFSKEGVIKIKYTNLYNKNMVSVSPKVKFTSKDINGGLIDVEAQGLLFRPFVNKIDE